MSGHYGLPRPSGNCRSCTGAKPRSDWDRQASGCERSELPVETVVSWIPTAERLNDPKRASLFNRSAAGAGAGPDSTGRSLRDQPEACILSRYAAGDYVRLDEVH